MTTRLRISFQSVCSIVVGLAGLALAAPAAAQDGGDSKINASWEFARANRLAGAGAVTRSIPHYEKVLDAAPEKYPQAHFNLAEVYRFKKNCQKAVLLYNAYTTFEKDDQSKADAQAGIAACTAGKKTGTLSVTIAESASSTVRIDGYVVGRGANVDGLVLLPGNYKVEAKANEHISQTRKVSIEAEKSAELEFDLEKKLFYGTLNVDVDPKGATVKLEPRELDSPKAKDDTIEFSAPLDKPKELATGKYFLEVTKPGYDRWIRNVHIQRDQETNVQVRMTEALPEAIRPKDSY